MGVVYSAHHEQTGQRVALKTVKVVDERQLNGIRREIHALSRIDHPGIVGIVDQGIHAGIPWYAMELLEGVSLRKRASKIRSGDTTSTTLFHTLAQINTDIGQTLVLDNLPLTEEEIADTEDGPPAVLQRAANGRLDEILTLVCRLCSPLAFLHGEGIIHRDLKPDNVVIVGDLNPVLFDFGLMSRISTKGGRATLSVDGLLHGTVAYMAPEQIRGELVDARADLYALGCILYELVTGRLPYRSPSASAMLYQHLERQALPPSERVTGVPRELDHLILKLLEKRPEERLGYADDVARALRDLGAVPSTRTAPKPRSYLYRPRFAGRQSALTSLHQQLGPFGGGLLLIGGESGVGKTRLALEFAREAAGRGFSVLVAECELLDTASRGAHGGAFYPLRKPLQAVVDRCLHQGPHESERIVGRRGPVLARFEPTLRELPGQVDQDEPATLDNEAEELRAISYLTDLFTAYADDNRVLILIDDLQWADDLTLKWLSHLQRNCPHELVVVGTYRLDETEERIDTLLASSTVTSLRLKRMSRESVGTMVGDMLALSPAPTTLVSFLAKHSEGNPFFVAEYLRMAVDEGILQRPAGGRWQIAGAKDSPFDDIPLPGPLRSLVSRRLVRLSPEAQALSEIAAVLGREADPDVLHALDGTEEGVWLSAVAELLEKQVMEDADGQLRFVHDKVREVAYEQIDVTQRAHLHGQAAAAIEAALEGDLVGHLAELGNHWHKAGNLDKARERYLATARRAASQYAHEDSERFYRTYLGLFTDPTPEFVLARNELAHQVLMPRGLNDETMIELQHALREARELGDVEGEAQSLENLGAVTRTVGRLQDAVDLFDEALVIRRNQEEPRGLGRVLCLIGFGYAGIGDLERSQASFAEAFDLAIETHDTWIEARALMGLARIDQERNNRYTAEESVKRALTAFRSLGDRMREARALNQLANIQADNGEEKRALTAYGRALALNREIGDRIGEGIVQANRAIILHKLGRSADSHAVYAEALQIFREVGHHRYQGHSMFCIARHLHTEGRLAEAKGLSQNALTLLAVVGDHKWTADVTVELSTIALEEDRTADAERHAERALKIAQELSLPTREAGALCILGQIAAAKGHFAQAETLHLRQRAAAERVGPELAAIADLYLGRVARLVGDLDTAEEVLSACVEGLAPENTRDRAFAHIERAWIEIARGLEPTDCLHAATAAHHAAVYLNPVVAKAIAEVGDSRPH